MKEKCFVSIVMPASSAPHSKVVGLRPSSKYCITSVTISQAEEDPASR